jgi:hypothetical protein
MYINCKHLVKKDNGCGINRGCGWNGEYCSISHLGKDCDHQEAMQKLFIHHTPPSYRLHKAASFEGACRWIRWRERERLGYRKCYSS